MVITKVSQEFDIADASYCWHVAFEETTGSRIRNHVVVMATEMLNPNDAHEAKRLASIKAAHGTDYEHWRIISDEFRKGKLTEKQFVRSCVGLKSVDNFEIVREIEEVRNK